jgi:hypothetical protein
VLNRRKAREQAKRAGARRTDRAGRPGLVVRGWGWLWAYGLVTSVVTGPRTRGQWQDYPSAIGTEWSADGNRWSMHGCAVGFRRRRGMPISGICRPGTPSPIGSNSVACSASVGRLHRCRRRVPDSRTDLAPRPHRAGRWCKALARWMNTSDSTEAAYRVEPDARCRNFTGAQMSAFGRVAPATSLAGAAAVQRIAGIQYQVAMGSVRLGNERSPRSAVVGCHGWIDGRRGCR